MGFGATGLGTEGTVMGAVIKLVSERVAAIFLTPGASGASLTTGATNRSDRGAGRSANSAIVIDKKMVPITSVRNIALTPNCEINLYMFRMDL